MKLLLLCLSLVLTSSVMSVVTYYQRISYQNYVPASGGNADYHVINIVWSESTIAAEVVGTGNWKYSIVRDDEGNPAVSNNNNALFDRYANYLIGIDGKHATKPYVAWDITASCASPKMNVSFKIKYFTCDSAATAFYDSSSAVTKVLVISDDTVTNTGTQTLSTALDVSILIGNDITATEISECS